MKRNKINWRVPKGMEITDLDRKVLYYQDRGHLVPTRELIKTPEQIEGIRRSGIINTGVLDLHCIPAENSGVSAMAHICQPMPA